MNKTEYMLRALQLAALGEGAVSPNPMVGAVIVARDRIIGEGFHRRYGGPHAEVNAIRSVSDKDRDLLKEATIFVTLEPCSHYGKTPPCSQLIINTGIPHVVVGAHDPNPKVNGRGIKMLRQAGISVETELLAKESELLNIRFMTAQTLHRPFIQLKWAQTANGITGYTATKRRLMISTPLTQVWMHRCRSVSDAIMVGIDTVICDNPNLDCRLWPGQKPKAVTFDSPRLSKDSKLLSGEHIIKPKSIDLPTFISSLFEDYGITSLMVEGGTKTLQQFIDLNLYDEIRIETSDKLGPQDGVKAPIVTSIIANS